MSTWQMVGRKAGRDVPGVGFGSVQASVPGLPPAVLHCPQPFPFSCSKCVNTQEHPSRWVCPLDCFVQLLGVCCLYAEVLLLILLFWEFSG